MYSQDRATVGTCRRQALVQVLWRDEAFPRLIDEIPRRLPRPDFPSIVKGFEGELQSFFSPANLLGQVRLSRTLPNAVLLPIPCLKVVKAQV